MEFKSEQKQIILDYKTDITKYQFEFERYVFDDEKRET